MRFGINDQHWSLIESLALAPLRSRGARIWIFGSRVRGDHKPFSDIDILFELPDNTALPTGFLPNLTMSLEDSSLPIKVDLVNVADLAESYRSRVLKERQEI
ncbi:MAG: nucleotidyltransferase domain-containing protein [Bdellovibrionaceae bacterium]|nr:nucleotidyltransferase domain-containing protein [Pseudobdellovibrionaceae bacterium]